MMMMKMAAVATAAQLLLLCSMISFADSQDSCDHYATPGGNITLPLDHKLEGSDRLKWMHNKTLVFDRKPPSTFIMGKNEDVTSNGSLRLTNLTRDSSGTYSPGVYNDGGKNIKNFKDIHLCLLDPVPKPTVKTECAKPSNVKFTCSVHQAKELTFEWLKNGKPLPGKKDKTLIEIADTVEKDDFSCKVSNKASSQISVGVKQTCFENKFIFPEELFGINIWIIVGGGAGIVVLLIVVVIFCCVRNRRKKSMQVKEEEELRLGWTNPDQQQHHHYHHQHNHPTDQHHHHHHHQQQPAGHTGPRQHRSKQQRDQQRDQQRSRASEHPNGHPHPSPRRPAQAPKPPDNNDDQPPPLPQPRKKAPKTPRA